MRRCQKHNTVQESVFRRQMTSVDLKDFDYSPNCLLFSINDLGMRYVKHMAPLDSAYGMQQPQVVPNSLLPQYTVCMYLNLYFGLLERTDYLNIHQ
jgi:hypothetical protein